MKIIFSPFISTASTKPSRRRRTAGRLPRAIWKSEINMIYFYKIVVSSNWCYDRFLTKLQFTENWKFVVWTSGVASMTIIASEGPRITVRRAYNMKPPPPSKGILLFLSNVLWWNCSSQCSQYVCNITAFLPLRRSLWALHPIVKAFEAEDSNKQDYLNPWTIITPAINKIIHFINKIKCLWVQFELRFDQMFNLWVKKNLQEMNWTVSIAKLRREVSQKLQRWIP